MPVDMPAYGFANWNLLPDMGISSAQTEAGLIITSRHGDAAWKGTLTTVPLAPKSDYPDFLAFLSRVVDLNLRVDFKHPIYRVPRAYTVDTWPLTDDPTLSSVTDLRHIVVGGLNVGMTLKRGDRLCLRQDGPPAVVCHRWLAADVTVSSAIAQTLELTPRLPTGVFAPGASVVFKDPIMRLAVVPGSWNAAEAVAPTGVSFDVLESLA